MAEQLSSVNADRIQWCIDYFGVPVDEVARKTRLKPGVLDKVLANERGLTFRQLSAIAKYFGRGVLFFATPGVPDETVDETANFRTLANQGIRLSPAVGALIRRLESHRDAFIALREELGTAGELGFAPPPVSSDRIPEAAATIREWLRIDRHGMSFDTLRESIQRRSVLVFRSLGYAGAWRVPPDSPVLGLSLYDETVPVIFVRGDSTAATRQTFTLAHELGHLVLHRSSNIDDADTIDGTSNSRKEVDANRFAGHFLVPTHLLDAIRRHPPSSAHEVDRWLSKYTNEWGVSAEVILRRLVDEKRIRRTLYREYREWRDAQSRPEPGSIPRMWRRREPAKILGDAFVRTVFDALNEKHLSLVGCSRLLDNLKVTDIRRLQAEYEQSV
jgi:Zn-dependent peptidase ImmA (M78 family)